MKNTEEDILIAFTDKLDDLMDSKDTDISHQNIYQAYLDYINDTFNSEESSNDLKEGLLIQLESALGECNTPIKQLVFRAAIDLPKPYSDGISTDVRDELEQRMALEKSILRELRNMNTKGYDISEIVNKICDAVFDKGAYNFKEETTFDIYLGENPVIKEIQKNICNDSGQIDSKKLYQFIKSDLINKVELDYDIAVDRVKESIYNHISSHSEELSTAYLLDYNQQSYLLKPDEIEADFKREYQKANLNSKEDIRKFTAGYISKKKKEVDNYALRFKESDKSSKKKDYFNIFNRNKKNASRKKGRLRELLNRIFKKRHSHPEVKGESNTSNKLNLGRMIIPLKIRRKSNSSNSNSTNQKNKNRSRSVVRQSF